MIKNEYPTNPVINPFPIHPFPQPLPRSYQTSLPNFHTRIPTPFPNLHRHQNPTKPKTHFIPSPHSLLPHYPHPHVHQQYLHQIRLPHLSPFLHLFRHLSTLFTSQKTAQLTNFFILTISKSNMIKKVSPKKKEGIDTEYPSHSLPEIKENT